MTNVIWIHQARPRPGWYELSATDKTELLESWEGLNSRATESGAEHLGKYSVRGQSDFSTVEVWKFDGPEEAFRFWSDRVEASYAAWFTFANQLGVTEGSREQ